MRIRIGLIVSGIAIGLFMPGKGAAVTASSGACRSLAAIYSRAPEQLDVQARMALDTCLTTEGEDASGIGNLSKDISGAFASPLGNSPQQAPEWGKWPNPARWNARWPSANAW